MQHPGKQNPPKRSGNGEGENGEQISRNTELVHFPTSAHRSAAHASQITLIFTPKARHWVGVIWGRAKLVRAATIGVFLSIEVP